MLPDGAALTGPTVWRDIAGLRRPDKAEPPSGNGA